ncbi:MAG: hypothetical protein MUF23_03235 [Pirellula sp.]|jgi:hypothetical protein|nr:hypothetical protein [Pirellula sp.]
MGSCVADDWEYKIRFGDSNLSLDFAVDVTANVTVVPEPSPVIICHVLGAGTLGLRWSKRGTIQ